MMFVKCYKYYLSVSTTLLDSKIFNKLILEVYLQNVFEL